MIGSSLCGVFMLMSLSRSVHIAHASSLRLRSAGAHFVRRPVGLASALRASDEYFTPVVMNSETRPDRASGRSGPPPRGAAEGCWRERYKPRHGQYREPFHWNHLIFSGWRGGSAGACPACASPWHQTWRGACRRLHWTPCRYVRVSSATARRFRHGSG